MKPELSEILKARFTAALEAQKQTHQRLNDDEVSKASAEGAIELIQQIAESDEVDGSLPARLEKLGITKKDLSEIGGLLEKAGMSTEADAIRDFATEAAIDRKRANGYLGDSPANLIRSSSSGSGSGSRTRSPEKRAKKLGFRCHGCGHRNTADVSLCQKCGAVLGEGRSIHCCTCAQRATPGARDCTFCGSSLAGTIADRVERQPWYAWLYPEEKKLIDASKPHGVKPADLLELVVLEAVLFPSKSMSDLKQYLRWYRPSEEEQNRNPRKRGAPFRLGNYKPEETPVFLRPSMVSALSKLGVDMRRGRHLHREVDLSCAIGRATDLIANWMRRLGYPTNDLPNTGITTDHVTQIRKALVEQGHNWSW